MKARTYSINGENSSSKIDMGSIQTPGNHSETNTNANTMILGDIDLNSNKNSSQMNAHPGDQDEFDPSKMDEFAEDPTYNGENESRNKIIVGKIEIFQSK